jgi:hypothetical protein
VVDLETGQAYYGTLWFGGRLISAFKGSNGQKFIGYVGKERTGQGYQAWTFYSLTQNQEAVNLARAWLNAHPEFMERSHDFQRPAPAPPNNGGLPPGVGPQPAQPPAWATGGAPAQPPVVPAWTGQPPARTATMAPAWTSSDPAQATTPVLANPPPPAPKPDWMNPPADGPQPTPAQGATVMDRLRQQAQQGAQPTSAAPATSPTHEEAPF